MGEIGEITVKARFDLFGDLLEQLSVGGLMELADSIQYELKRRNQEA
jgi:hypothetical protein